jgi:hypothetical protein
MLFTVTQVSQVIVVAHAHSCTIVIVHHIGKATEAFVGIVRVFAEALLISTILVESVNANVYVVQL